MTIGKLLETYRKERKISQKKLGNLLGVADATISKYEMNKVFPPNDKLFKIINILEIPFEEVYEYLPNKEEILFFFNAKFEKDKNDLREKTKERMLNFLEKMESEAEKIPVKPVVVLGKISAGMPVFAEENRDGVAYAPANQIKDGYDYFYLRVNGDSMNRLFNDGDIVLVQKQETLENGEIGLIRVNGFDATIKRYYFEDGIVTLKPESTNEEHQTQKYDTNITEVAIVGKAISYQGNIK